MIVGGYTLDLYCDNDQDDNKNYHWILTNGTYIVGDYEINHQYVGENFSEAVRQAKKDGWKVNRKNDICICPVCMGKFNKTTP
jgi:hypothetical protein